MTPGDGLLPPCGCPTPRVHVLEKNALKVLSLSTAVFGFPFAATIASLAVPMSTYGLAVESPPEYAIHEDPAVVTVAAVIAVFTSSAFAFTYSIN